VNDKYLKNKIFYETNRVGFANFFRLNPSGRPLSGSSLDADKEK
jgi:hypothetical protein